MIVYIDLIIIMNILIDLLLIISLSFLLKRNPPIIRIILSSIFGGISTIILFYINNNFLLSSYKLLTSIIMVIIAFKYKNFNYFKDNLIYLYVLSIILGGTIYLLNNSINLSNKGLIFSSNGLEINIILFILLTPIILYKYIQKEKAYKLEYTSYYKVEIIYNNKKIKETGFLDTGNTLKDPYFHKPIILINKDLIEGDIKTFLVPYYTVNNKDLLEVFKPTKVIVNNQKTKDTLIGLTDVNLRGIRIILNKEIL